MSKRAEELFAKIARGKPSTLTGQWREPYTPQEEIALIDAELRKTLERAADRLHTVMGEKVVFDYRGKPNQSAINDIFERQFTVYRAAILAEEED